MAFRQADDFAEKLLIDLAENVRRQRGKDVGRFGIVKALEDAAQEFVVEIKVEREFVRRFVAASLQGWNFAYDNPNIAAGILQALVPTQSAYATALTNVSTLKAMRKLRYSAAQVGHPYGWESARDWGATIKAMVNGGALTSTPPAASALYTNAFIPGVTSKKK